MSNRAEIRRGDSNPTVKDDTSEVIENSGMECFSSESSDEEDKEKENVLPITGRLSLSVLAYDREHSRERISITRNSRSASGADPLNQKHHHQQHQPMILTSSVSPPIRPPIKLWGEMKKVLSNFSFSSSHSVPQNQNTSAASSSSSSASSSSTTSLISSTPLASTPSPPASPRGDPSVSPSIGCSPVQVHQIPESDDELLDTSPLMCYLWTLPHCLVMRFHQYLSMYDISQCISVSRDWFQLCKGEIFWKQLFKEWWPLAQDSEGREVLSLPSPPLTTPMLVPDRWKQICIATFHRRKSLLVGKSISSTGLKRSDKEEANKIVTLLGGTYAADFSRQVNYLIAATYRSEKYRLAVRIGTPVVTFQWLLDTANKVNLQQPNLYRPTFDPPIICGTGFSVRDREMLKEEVLELGGKYSNALTRTCTHLLARPANDGRKLAAAQRWQVTIHKLNEADPLKPVVRNCFPASTGPSTTDQ